MFASIGFGTYVFFAALNFVVIFPVVYLYFPETKGRSLEEVSVLPSLINVQLDVLFAVANTERKNAVKMSLGDEVPLPGSNAAERAMSGLAMDQRGPGPLAA